jgi:hypothetical protein
MRSGSEVRIPSPTKASEVRAMLDTVCKSFDAELYVREEGGKAILYAVKRIDDGRGLGTILASRAIPFFPEEV